MGLPVIIKSYQTNIQEFSNQSRDHNRSSKGTEQAEAVHNI